MANPSKCSACNGEGRIHASYAGQMDRKLTKCEACKGSGQVTTPDIPPWAKQAAEKIGQRLDAFLRTGEPDVTTDKIASIIADHAPDVSGLVEACRPFLTEALSRADFHHSSWNPDAHVQMTMAIQECRDLSTALASTEGETK